MGRCSHRASGSTSSCLPTSSQAAPGAGSRAQQRQRGRQDTGQREAVQKHGDWQPAVMRRRTGVGPGRAFVGTLGQQDTDVTRGHHQGAGKGLTASLAPPRYARRGPWGSGCGDRGVRPSARGPQSPTLHRTAARGRRGWSGARLGRLDLH